METKLDLIDKRILAELDKNCRIPNSILGKKIRRSRETVKYRIQQLQARGIITGFITSINPNKLGYYMFKVYLKLENIPEEREKFFEELKQNKDIYWLGISAGAFDCVFAILCKSITEYFLKINSLLSKWRHLIISKVLGLMVDTRQYNKKFFTNEEGQYVIFGGDVIDNKIDDLDYKILSTLANDARIPIVRLARKVNSTPEVVRARIKKLEEKGVILNYRIAVDFNKLGLEFHKVFIYFRTLSKKDLEALFEWTRVHPNAVYHITSIAPWDAELEFVVNNYQQLNSVIDDLRKEFPHVIRNYEHLIITYETWMPAYKEFLKTSPQNPLTRTG